MNQLYFGFIIIVFNNYTLDKTECGLFGSVLEGFLLWFIRHMHALTQLFHAMATLSTLLKALGI